MTLQNIDQMTRQLDMIIRDAHDMVANAYLTMTRPLTEIDRSQALTELNESMRQLRECGAQISQIAITTKGVDSDLMKLSESIRGIRRPSMLDAGFGEKSTAVDPAPTPRDW